MQDSLCALLVFVTPIAICASEPQVSSFEQSVVERHQSAKRMTGAGTLGGRLTDALTGTPLAGKKVNIWDSEGRLRGTTTTDSAGNYGYPASHGTFYVTTSSKTHQNELFDNILCNEPECDPTTGSPISVQLEQHTPGISFQLQPLGTIAGRVTDAATGKPVRPASVYIWDSAGSFASFAETNAEGKYESSGLPEGTYYARSNTFGAYPNELYDDLPCPLTAQDCDPLEGTPIAVNNATVTHSVDFVLGYLQGISGTVNNQFNGTPLAGIAIDIWNLDEHHVAEASTNALGDFSAALPAGAYFVSTDNTVGFTDEVYDNVACSTGSALSSDCAPNAGSLIHVSADEYVTDIDFALDDLVFDARFE